MAAALLMLMIASACGQKNGVSQQPGLDLVAGGYVNPDTGEVVTPAPGTSIDATTGETIDIATGETIEPGETTTTTDSSGNTTTTTTDSSGNTTTTTSEDDPGQDSETEGGPPIGGDSTGVTDDVIKIGIHAPITGAAPVPSDSATKGAALYWRWMEENGESIFGRRVEVVIKNDQYNPSHAVAVCKEMVEKDKVFLLAGSAGTDQIQACARYAHSVGVPYLSAGVTETGLSNMPTYFAVSTTYPDQGPIMADFMIDELGADEENNAIVYFNTQNFIDGKDAFVAAMEERGVEVYQRAVSKTAGTSEAQAITTDLQQRNIDNVNVLLAPLFFLQMLQTSGSANYLPQWTAVGIQMTFDTIPTVGCRNGSIDGMKAFAPFPAWIDSDKFDPDFRKAVAAIHPEENNGTGDDFMWLGWSGSTGMRDFLTLPGENLTRERFVYFLERAKNMNNGIAPPISFAPDDHWGGSAVHVSEASCVDGRWHTLMTNKTDF